MATSVDLRGPSPDTWHDATTRRLRTLIRTAPLHRIEASKGQRDLPLGLQDLRALALRALDLAIEHMGLGAGASMAELIEGLRPVVLQADPSLDHSTADAIAGVVVEALLNEKERRQAFHEPYLAFEVDRVERRYVPFHLLREHAHPDGQIVLKATTEAINLYAGMLEFPVEDAQVAEEAVLRSQLQRGRIADAVRTAQRARLRSIEYEQKILAILETARRDVAQLDWVRGVLGLLEQARDHLEDRLATERELIAAVDARLAAPELDGGPELAALHDVLVECEGRHLRLHARVIPANREYLDEQDRQAFRPRALGALPDLEAAVLRPALGAEIGAIAAIADRLIAGLRAPRAPAVPWLRGLIGRLLAPARESEPGIEALSVELETVGAIASRFSAEDRALVATILGELDVRPVALGELLSRVRERAGTPAAAALLVLEVLQAFDPSSRSEAGDLAVTPSSPSLDDPAFFGDDLVVARAG